jgi:hypothetical protein
LLRERFFVQCKQHADSHKSECNMYCMDCMNGALCSLCLAYHKDHHAIQVNSIAYQMLYLRFCSFLSKFWFFTFFFFRFPFLGLRESLCFLLLLLDTVNPIFLSFFFFQISIYSGWVIVFFLILFLKNLNSI